MTKTTRAMRPTHVKLLTSACTTALMIVGLPGLAMAQDAPPPADATQPVSPAAEPGSPAATEPDATPGSATPSDATQAPLPPADQGAIVVTGVRAGIRSSIAIKRNEDSIVEAVSAEDIGKLPDVSVAESIARLPGLAAQRVAGRAQIISVRGFPPDFTTVLLNGRQQASSGYNRAVEFDQYPSELLSSVVVYKTPDASVAGMGLAGTVDLRTVRPLSVGKRTIAVNLRGEADQGGGRNKDMPKRGWRGSVSLIDHNKDGTFGWALGYAHLDAPSHTNRTQNWFYDNYGGPTYILSGQEVFAKNRREIRDGFMGTAEWRPTDNVHSTLDVYFSRFKQHEVNRGAQWFSDAYADGVTYDNLQSENIDGTDFATSGHVNNVAPILRFDDNRRVDKLFSVGLNNEFKASDRTTLIADLSYSSNKRDETYIEAYGGYGAGPFQTRTFDDYDFKIPRDNFPQYSGFGLDYADANQVSLGDRAPWGGWGHDGLKKSPHVKETVGAIDASMKHDLDWNFIKSLDFGINYTGRHKQKTVDELDLFLKNNREQVLVDPRFLTGPTSLSFAGFPDVLGVQIADALGTYYDERQLTDANHYDKAWDIKEDIITFEAKANIESGNLHGNAGVQVVNQKQQSSGLRINQTVTPFQLLDVVEGATYTDILPSLNLSYDIDNHNKLRFAAAKVMARPRMDDMRANFVPSFNDQICIGRVPACQPGEVVNPWSASGGNPKLKPWRAKEVNVAYEWYGSKATYFSINAYYLWLDTYIYNQQLVGDFTGLTPPEPGYTNLINAGYVVSPLGTLTAPANGDGGKVYGVELSGALEFGQLSHYLEGFGVIGSVSWGRSKLKTESAAQLGELNGFSKWVYNVTGYYERNGFQARASYRYRSKFKGEVVGLFTNPDFPFILADRQLDAQVGYTFPEGTKFQNFGVLLQVNNVLNSPYRTSAAAANGVQMLNTYEEWGRQWLLGANYRF